MICSFNVCYRFSECPGTWTGSECLIYPFLHRGQKLTTEVSNVPKGLVLDVMILAELADAFVVAGFVKEAVLHMKERQFYV